MKRIEMNLWEKHIDRLANGIIRLIKTEEYGERHTQIVRFMLKVIISEMEKIVLLFVIFSCIHRLTEFMWIFCFMVSLRVFTGGIHRNTTFSCFIHSLIVFTCVMITSEVIDCNSIMFIGLVLAEFFSIIAFAPILSEKRVRYNKLQQMRMKKRAMVVIIAIIVIYTFAGYSIRQLAGVSLLFHVTELIYAGMKQSDYLSNYLSKKQE